MSLNPGVDFFFKWNSASEFSEYMFNENMFSWLTVPLVRMKCLSLSLMIHFSWSVFWNFGHTCFLSGFIDWSVLLYPFTLRQCLSLKLKCVSCRQRIGRFCFLFHSVSLSLLIRKLRSLIFKDISEVCVLFSAILWSVFGVAVCVLSGICVLMIMAS